LLSAYLDSTTTTPIYFILSPGANPVITVEELAKNQGVDLKHVHKISLGQG
jgi:dynein heavy chain